MQQIAYGKGRRWRPPLTRKTFLVMKMITLILFFSCLVAGAKGLAQNITISLKNAPLEKVFKEVERQSHYRFVYTKEQLTNVNPVSVEIKNASLESILLICFREQPITYAVENKYILIKNVEKKKVIEPLNDLRGKIVNEKGESVPGVTITVKGTNKSTVSNNEGEFYFKEIDLNAVLVISGAELKNVEIRIQNRNYLTISVNAKIGELDQVIMMAYGQTTKRLNTGNIAKVTAEEIGKQPVSNPIAALQGRIPGVIITQTSGVPGAGFKVEIRGRTALDLSLSRNDPLYVIDGVAFEMGNTATNLIVSAANNPTSTSEGGLSALNSINPHDIESIEVLKDADATAIYGSRGANGVILITTKFGQSGKTKINVGFNSGSSRITRAMKMLNTEQYVQMRKEAFANDGLIATVITAPDILLWDTTRYTNIQKLLIGGTAKYLDGQLSVSGGNQFTTFRIGGGIHKETTVFPGDFSDVRASTNITLNHLSPDKKFNLSLKAQYSNDNNQLISFDISQYLRLPPNLKLYDSAGNLNW